MKRKLNAWTLSGLMIGPILGSGIIFLPTLAYKALGEHAILAWVLMMFLGGLFAYVFAKMTILTSSNEGMSVIVGKVLGERFRELASNYLTMAVFFGPVAVIVTAADFIKSFLPKSFIMDNTWIAFFLLIFCAVIIALGTQAVSRLVLVLSSVTGILLVAGSVGTIFSVGQVTVPMSLPNWGTFGHTLLIIFWAIIGWEIVGNYIEDVENPKKTIFKATKVSLVAITLIYLLTTFALQTYYAGKKEVIQIQMLLAPLFGTAATRVFSLLAFGLCVCTILLFVGAVARQLTARGVIGLLPAFFAKKNVSLIILTGINLGILVISALGFLSVEDIVSIANTFFIGNALLGLLSGFVYMKGIWSRLAIGILIGMLVVMFCFSAWLAWVLMILVTVATFARAYRR